MTLTCSSFSLFMASSCDVRALELLQRYYEGEIINVLDETNEGPSSSLTGGADELRTDHSSPAENGKSEPGSALLAEELHPRSSLPPLLVNLADRCVHELNRQVASNDDVMLLFCS